MYIMIILFFTLQLLLNKLRFQIHLQCLLLNPFVLKKYTSTFIVILLGYFSSLSKSIP